MLGTWYWSSSQIALSEGLEWTSIKANKGMKTTTARKIILPSYTDISYEDIAS